MGSGKKRENQSIGSGYLTSLGTIKETFEELHFLEKQLLVSEGFIVWKPWQKTRKQRTLQVYCFILTFVKEKVRVRVFPYVIDALGKSHCTMYKSVDMNEKIAKH